MPQVEMAEAETSEEPRALIEVIDLEDGFGPLAKNKNNVCK